MREGEGKMDAYEISSWFELKKCTLNQHWNDLYIILQILVRTLDLRSIQRSLELILPLTFLPERRPVAGFSRVYANGCITSLKTLWVLTKGSAYLLKKKKKKLHRLCLRGLRNSKCGCLRTSKGCGHTLPGWGALPPIGVVSANSCFVGSLSFEAQILTVLIP